MNVPLSVRIASSNLDQHVTRQLRDLSYRSTVPGGFASLSMALDRPLLVDDPLIRAYAKVYVYDARTGETAWEGRLEDPGRGASPDGQTWQVTAVGPAAHAQDRTLPLIYIDRRLDAWLPASKTSTGQAELSEDANGTPVLRQSLPRGVVAASGYKLSHIYRAVADAGQIVAAVNFTTDAGVTDTDWHERLYSFTGPNGTRTQRRDTTLNTAGVGVSRAVFYASAEDSLEMRLERTTSSQTIANDVTYVIVANLVVNALRYDKTGAQVTSYTDDILASDVVADLLGRGLFPFYDGANAAISATANALTQVAWPDGATPAQILDDLMTIEPYFWAAWESGSNGLHRFEWTIWPTTTVRYEADVDDGYDAPGTADALYNAVRVRYKNAAGQIRTVRRTQTVQALTDIGLTREAFIDLGDNTGSSGAAALAGDRFLADHGSPLNGGTLTVSRPILDIAAGRMVDPHLIRPGNLIRVRGVNPNADSLNPSGDNGVTIMRIVAVDYSASDNTARLSLDSYPRSVATQLSQVQKALAARRRR
jgi:hypothetical protein